MGKKYNFIEFCYCLSYNVRKIVKNQRKIYGKGLQTLINTGIINIDARVSGI